MKQAEALADVERITEEIWRGVCALRPAWGRGELRGVVTNLLHRDVIRVGARPNIERPMEGQTTIDDA